MAQPRVQHTELQVHRIAILASFLVLGIAVSCLGDQLQWNPLDVCRDAAQLIGRSSLLVSFCSLADRDHVELWLVSDAETVTTSARGLYELIVSGRRRYQSDDAYASDEFPVLAEQWTFHKVKRVDEFAVGIDDEFAVGIDLAYVYIHMGGGSFRCLGKLLGLDCVVGVETIHLPYHIVEHTPRRQKPSTAHPHGPLMEQPSGVPFRSAETLLDATWIRFAKLLLPVQLSQFPGSDPRFPSPHGSS